MLTLSGTPDFAPFGEFMISLTHYMYISGFVSFRTMFTDYGLFAWISPTALSQTYFIIWAHIDKHYPPDGVKTYIDKYYPPDSIKAHIDKYYPPDSIKAYIDKHYPPSSIKAYIFH